MRKLVVAVGTSEGRVAAPHPVRDFRRDGLVYRIELPLEEAA